MTAWIDHVREKAKEYGLSYKAAMSDARVKGSYTKAPRQKATKPQAPSEPPKTAKERRTMAASRAMELIHKRTADGEQSWHDAVSRHIQDRADEGYRFMKEKKPRKPMSEETKAMLKERRATKKADVAKKFESFWERHGMGTTATATQAVVEAIAGPSKQRRKPTDEQRARWRENARNKLLNSAAPSVFGAKADANRELARQYRNDPKMRKRLTELNKKRGGRLTMYQAVMENLLG
jgi:hypothetical protein